MHIKTYRTRIDEAIHRSRSAEENVELEQSRLNDARVYVSIVVDSVRILQVVAEEVQQKAHWQIAHTVTRCLEAVFQEDAYEFCIVFEQKRGRTEAKLVFVRDGMEVDPLSASGGGVVDVAAFALRLSCLLLRRPPLRRLLVLDEPLKFLSAEHRPRMRELIESLAVELGVQFVIVTHIEEFRCGKVVEL